MVQERDETGGLDTEKATRLLAERERPWAMIGAVKAARLYGGLEVETTFDPLEQPFLRDHQFEGEPLLPGVMGTEAFAEVAGLLAPGYSVAGVQDVKFLAPFKFYHCKPRTLHLSAFVEPLADGELLAHTVLRSVTQPAKPGLPLQVKDHFVAGVRLARTGSEAAAVPFQPAPVESMTIDAERIYRVYFHGPAYQVLERAGIDGTSAIGLMAADLPAGVSPENAQVLMAPRLIELCFQTAGVWQIATQEVMALPAGIRQVVCYRQAEEAAGRRVYALVTVADKGEKFDARVVDDAGNVYIALEGYWTVQLPGSVRFA
jgi:hypothetical protein